MCSSLSNTVGGLQGMQLYQKETPMQVLPCEYREIFKNICFEKYLRPTAGSDFSQAT